MTAGDVDQKIQEAIEQKVEERLDEVRVRVEQETQKEPQRKDAETLPEQETSGRQNYSRRSFLKALGLSAGGLALSSAASANLVPLKPPRTDKEVRDIVSNSDSISVNTFEATDELGNPTYPTLSDVPTNLPEGTQVYVADENAIYVEDGT